MARGKHGRRAERKRDQDAQNKREQILAKTLEEQEKRKLAEQDLAEASRLISDIRDMRVVLSELHAERIQTLTVAISELSSEILEIERELRDAKKQDSPTKIVSEVLFGSDLDLAERMIVEGGMYEEGTMLTGGVHMTRALKKNTAAVRMIQRARGLRK